jgi:hypothetical protein
VCPLDWICLLALLGAGSDNDEPDDYVFIQDLDRLVEVCHGLTTSVGHLNKDGRFLPRDGLKRQKGQAYSSNAEWIEPLNMFPEKNVYEYRSGRLIKGEIDPNGDFIPEKGAKVLDFKDYHYRKDGPRIWNLPGRFEKRTKLS